MKGGDKLMNTGIENSKIFFEKKIKLYDHFMETWGESLRAKRPMGKRFLNDFLLGLILYGSDEIIFAVLDLPKKEGDTRMVTGMLRVITEMRKDLLKNSKIGVSHIGHLLLKDFDEELLIKMKEEDAKKKGLNIKIHK